MKRLKQTLLILSIFSIILSCSDKNLVKDELFPNPPDFPLIQFQPDVAASLLCGNSFKFTYLRSRNVQEIYLIKGIAMDIYEYGRNIKIIEDIKGNYNGESSIFVWGEGYPSEDSGFVSIYCNRVDNITNYNEKDTLIMFLYRIDGEYEGFIEKSGDYATLIGSRSTLKFSNNFVIGPINTLWDTETMQWNEFQKECHNFLNSDKKPKWWFYKLCEPKPFCSKYIWESDSQFFIKGEVVSTENKYGKKIKLIADFKGNFPKELDTFTVWGDDDPKDPTSTRYDDLTQFKNEDILVMVLWQSDFDYNNYQNINEKNGDFTTKNGSFSVLKLTNNYVSGYITSCYGVEERMSLEEFQKLLETIKGAN